MGSPTFDKSVELSAANRRQLRSLEGFAHGFLVLEEGTEFLYKTTDFWHAASERSIRWDDPEIGVECHWKGRMVRERMRGAGLLVGAEVFG